MLATRGSVSLLVVLYAINVFITFCLSQAGMVRHWWRQRGKVRDLEAQAFDQWVRPSSHELHPGVPDRAQVRDGGWITLLITGALVAVAVAIKRFYHQAGRSLARLDHLMATAAEIDVQALDAETRKTRRRPPRPDPRGKTAVLLVSGFNGTGLHTLFSIRRVFGMPSHLAVHSAGIIDADRFKGAGALTRLRKHVETGLSKYVRFMRAKGYNAEGIAAIGTDVSEGYAALPREYSATVPLPSSSAARDSLPGKAILTRLLFNHVAFAVQRRLHRVGIPFHHHAGARGRPPEPGGSSGEHPQLMFALNVLGSIWYA